MKLRLNLASVSFTLLFTLMLSFPAVSRSAELDDLTRNAETILFGKVSQTTCQWAETSLNILTHTTFQVEKSVKGELKPGESITIETFGGTINGMKQKAPGSPTFKEGEHHLIFLNAGPKGLYHVYRDKEGVIPFISKGEDQTTQDGKGLTHLIRDVNLVLNQ
jgi:hypothetical protein